MRALFRAAIVYDNNGIYFSANYSDEIAYLRLLPYNTVTDGNHYSNLLYN